MAAKKTKAKKSEAAAGVEQYALLRTPVVTEKSSLVGDGGRTVVFRVATSSTKASIREAVEKIFKVNVEAVRTCNYMGKPKRTRGAMGRRAGFKKAYVTLKEGQKIDIVEGL